MYQPVFHCSSLPRMHWIATRPTPTVALIHQKQKPAQGGLLLMLGAM
jgi:hypothetical protein